MKKSKRKKTKIQKGIAPQKKTDILNNGSTTNKTDSPEREQDRRTDIQSARWLLTINNPHTKDYSQDRILQKFLRDFKTLDYLCMADEQGSCYHTHVFVCFSSRVRFSKIKKAFPEAHIDKVKGTVSDNVAYVRKSGKWAEDIKHGTKIEGTFREYGERPADSRGKRKDMTELYQMIQDGYSNVEILNHNQDYIINLDKLDKIRTLVLTEKFKATMRKDIEVIYAYGKTGTGKTSGVLREYGCEKVYRVTDYQHPFDSYNCQPVLAFEEFRSSLPLKDMLNYCDIYPLELPARFANKYACYNTVFILSNWPLERQYVEMQQVDPDSWKAFLRRIKKVRVYSKQGIQQYDSVEAYFNRFVTDPIEVKADNPFLTSDLLTADGKRGKRQ